jgi:DNA-binding transcriptional ArsR family regulator
LEERLAVDLSEPAAAPRVGDRPLDQAFHALADTNRRAIVARLTRGAASVSELAAPLDVSLPTVLQHLGVLERSGLEKVGRVRTCRLELGPMRAVERWIVEHRAIWERRLDMLGDVLAGAVARVVKEARPTASRSRCRGTNTSAECERVGGQGHRPGSAAVGTRNNASRTRRCLRCGDRFHHRERRLPASASAP